MSLSPPLPSLSETSTIGTHLLKNGMFQKLKYNSEQFTETGEKYSKTQPLDSRKLGFGSRDASKTGEFTDWKTTERYRSVVKQETQLMERHRSVVKETEILQKPKVLLPPKDREGKELTMPVFMYDIGRSSNTYDPKSIRDCFYSLPKHATKDIRRLGNHRPSSAIIGAHAWNHKYQRPVYGSQNGVEKFYDKGHLSVPGV